MKSKKIFVNTKKRLLGGILVFSITTGTLAGCSPKSEDVELESTKIQVETTKVSIGNMESDNEFVGTVESDMETSIYPDVSGKVTQKNYEVGDYVTSGDLLFTIDDTSAKITKQSAESGVDSAKASVKTAENNAIAQQASNAATKATVNETLGTMDSDEQKLQNEVSSAERSVGAAKGNYDNYNQQFATAQDNTSKAEDKVDSADESVSSTEDYLESREEIQKTYNSIKEMSDADAVTAAKSHGVSESDVPDGTTAEEAADAYLSYITGGSLTTEYELTTAVESARSAFESAESTKTSLEGSKSSALQTQISAAINSQIAKDSILTAQEAESYAQRLLEDYQNFTKASTMAKANADIVSGDASEMNANNSLTIANANLESAQATLASAELALNNTQVKTPVSGMITAINVEQYGNASTQSAAYVISSENSKKVTFYVAENTMVNMRKGQMAVIEKNGKECNATISTIEKVADESNGLFKIEAMVSGADTSNIVTGTKVKVRTATKHADNVMRINKDAVYFESDQAYVYCLVDGIATKISITIGIKDDTYVEVTNGLAEDDKVITSWSTQLKDGAEIEEITSSVEEAEESTEEQTEAEIMTVETNTVSTESNVVEAAENVNIRAAASTDSEKIGTASEGQRFKRIEETDDGWSKIIYEDIEAFVKTEYLQVVTEEAEISTVNTEEGTLVQEETVNE